MVGKMGAAPFLWLFPHPHCERTQLWPWSWDDCFLCPNLCFTVSGVSTAAPSEETHFARGHQNAKQKERDGRGVTHWGGGSLTGNSAVGRQIYKGPSGKRVEVYHSPSPVTWGLGTNPDPTSQTGDHIQPPSHASHPAVSSVGLSGGLTERIRL